MTLDINIVSVIFLVLIIPFSLLAEGIRRKILARMQNRIGPPIWQPVYDVIKLWKKAPSDTLAKKNIFFTITPILYFVITFALFLFIPFSIISFEYDFILFIYILVLDSLLYVLVGLASNNPYSIIGSTRELTLMVCYEIVFTIVIITIFVFNNVISLSQFNSLFLFWKLPIAAVCFFYVALVEIRVTPYDTVEAYTEVLESVKSEYSGKGLAFLEFAKALKLIFFAMLAVFLFIGLDNLLLFFILSILMVIVFAFTQATTCRYRIDQVFKIFTIVLVFAIIEFVRIKFIIW